MHNDGSDNRGEQQSSTDGLWLGRHLSDEEVATLVYSADLERPGSSPTPDTTRSSALALFQAHADTCDACRLVVAKAREQDSATARLLSLLDSPAPLLDIGPVLARARKSDRAARSRVEHTFPMKSLSTPALVSEFTRTRRSRHYRYAIAASLLFAAVGVTAMAFPGAPLRRLWDDIGRKSVAAAIRGGTGMPRADASSAVSTSGVAVAPALDFTIEFRGAGARLPEVSVRYCDTTLATLHVRHPRAMQNASSLDMPSDTSAAQPVALPERFSVSADRIVVTQDTGTAAGEATYELIVPNNTRSLSVTAGEDRVDVRPLRSNEPSGTDRCDPPIVVGWKH